jgi:hypothetical protein
MILMARSHLPSYYNCERADTDKHKQKPTDKQTRAQTDCVFSCGCAAARAQDAGGLVIPMLLIHHVEARLSSTHAAVLGHQVHAIVPHLLQIHPEVTQAMLSSGRSPFEFFKACPFRAACRAYCMCMSSNEYIYIYIEREREKEISLRLVIFTSFLFVQVLH